MKEDKGKFSPRTVPPGKLSHKDNSPRASAPRVFTPKKNPTRKFGNVWGGTVGGRNLQVTEYKNYDVSKTCSTYK